MKLMRPVMRDPDSTLPVYIAAPLCLIFIGAQCRDSQELTVLLASGELHLLQPRTPCHSHTALFMHRRHSVLYDDGEREAVLLASEKLKWLLPPDVGPSEDAAATAARHSQRRRPRRRTLVESSDDVSLPAGCL